MIINTGSRTDTVQFYPKWLIKRFEEGVVYTRNPHFPKKVTRYTLTPETVDCVVFCSKNYAPILPDLHKITSRFHTYFHYTITGYGKDIEPGVPSIERSIDTLKRLSAMVGKERLSWRYDPVLLTARYSVDYHLQTFAWMIEAIAPYVSRVIFSFVELYERLRYNMPELIALSQADMDRLAAGLGRLAATQHLPIQTCGNSGDWSRYGIDSSGCTTLDILGRANGVTFRSLKHRGQRLGCHCIETRDIGFYDSCPNGCRYCYANKNQHVAIENFKTHDVNSPILLGHLEPDDIIQEGQQSTYLAGIPIVPAQGTLW